MDVESTLYQNKKFILTMQEYFILKGKIDIDQALSNISRLQEEYKNMDESLTKEAIASFLDSIVHNPKLLDQLIKPFDKNTVAKLSFLSANSKIQTAKMINSDLGCITIDINSNRDYLINIIEQRAFVRGIIINVHQPKQFPSPFV